MTVHFRAPACCAPHGRFPVTVLVMTAVLALAHAAYGQPPGSPPPGSPGGFPGGPPGGFPGGPAGFMRMFPAMAALDSDGDGEISSAELAEATAHLKTLDINNDGKLSAEELRPNFPAGPGGPGGFPGGGFAGPPGGPGGFGGPPGGGASGEELATRLMEFDADKDGKLTSDELPARMQGMLTRGDADKDGKLTREEILAMAAAEGGRGPGGGGRGEGGRRGEGRGGPGGGGPGGPGGPGGFVERMFEFDADKDGKLTRDELQAMAAQFQGGGGGPGGQPGGPGGREGGRREGGERGRRPPVEE